MKTPEEKEIIVKRYLNGETSTKLANEYEINNKRFYVWVKKYQESGIEGLISNTGKIMKV